MVKRSSFFLFISLLCSIGAVTCGSGAEEIKARIRWERLSVYHDTMTLEEFKSLAGSVYSPDGSIYEYLDMTQDYIDIYPDRTKSTTRLFRLYLAGSARTQKSFNKPFRDLASIRARLKQGAKPLHGLRILLDPGHIGGEYARMEQRIFQTNDLPPIMEADLNLRTAQIMKQKLEELGAVVFTTKNTLEPVTKAKLQDFRRIAQRKLSSDPDKPPDPVLLRKEMERLLVRTSEIRARAQRVNRIKPDVTLCIHFNAAPGKPGKPLVEDNRLVVFILGCFERHELEDEEQRYRLFSKLLERSHKLELSLAGSIADALAEETGLPPVVYRPGPPYLSVGNNPYIYARNLAANRLFDGPVIYLEPYYQNNAVVYERALSGDYEGEREIAGKKYVSIFREYAGGVVNGLLEFFAG